MLYIWGLVEVVLWGLWRFPRWHSVKGSTPVNAGDARDADCREYPLE